MGGEMGRGTVKKPGKDCGEGAHCLAKGYMGKRTHRMLSPVSLFTESTRRVFTRRDGLNASCCYRPL